MVVGGGGEGGEEGVRSGPRGLLWRLWSCLGAGWAGIIKPLQPLAGWVTVGYSWGLACPRLRRYNEMERAADGWPNPAELLQLSLRNVHDLLTHLCPIAVFARLLALPLWKLLRAVGVCGTVGWGSCLVVTDFMCWKEMGISDNIKSGMKAAEVQNLTV